MGWLYFKFARLCKLANPNMAEVEDAGLVKDAHGHRSLGCGSCDRSRRRH